MARSRKPNLSGIRSDEPTDAVPVVGVGASAGGLDAFTELLSSMPPHPGLAMVLVMHLQPTHPSDLPAILGRKTSLPVVQAESGMTIEADHVYVIPPNVEMRIGEDVFVLSPRPETSTPSMTVDILFASLAERYGSQAVGVVLSGSASDGTKGLAAIKEENGITIVQDPATAGHRGMPESAITAGVADVVLPIEGIARELVRLAEHPYVRSPRSEPEDDARSLTADEEEVLGEVIGHVKRATGLDLSHYKRPTLFRRIERRMAMRRADDLSQYLAILTEDAHEAAELLNDALVRVTSFFRDPEAFESLKTQVLPSMMHEPGDEPIRAWVAGCATGQEAYSIAIVLLEHLATIGSDAPIQIFASDLRESDLDFARRGVFPPETETEVTPERLARFFTRVEDGFQISKSIREACVFARHDVTSDPPFSKLHLVSCRNLLIYVDRETQQRLLNIFHYALLPDGILMLGNSEGASAAPGLFGRAEQRGIFTRLPGETPRLAFGGVLLGRHRAITDAGAAVQSSEQWRETEWSDVQRRFDELLLERYAPAAVLIDERLRVKQIRGEAGEYLRFKPGDATLDLVSMVSDGLASSISAAVDRAGETERPARAKVVQPREGGGHVTVEIAVVPVFAVDQPTSYAVFFDEGDTVSRADGETGPEPTEAEYLRQELEAATQRLSILRHSRDSANEALRAANEEIQSSNEELQSMNEELETAKEELQSTNEELTTLNDELQARNIELGLRNDDLNNLLSSASIAMLVLEADLSIRRYTHEAAQAFNLIPGDVGRRITDIRWPYSLEDVEAKLKTVIETAEPLEYEVTDESGCWFRLSVKPYVTGEGRTRGAVLTLLDIDVLRRAQATLDELVADRTAELGTTLAQLEDAQGVKDSFLAHMSHELRTPLNSIIGFSQILLDGLAGEVNPEQQRQLGMIHASGKHLLAIVSDLLDLERIEAGAMPVTAKPFDLAAVCRKVCALLGPVAEAKGIELRMPAAESSIDLVSDELKMEQILLNVVDNAIKFTKSGHVAVDASASDDTCVITVTDTGRGMTPEQLEQAFQEFQRVRDDTADMVPGTGLGLSIAVRLAELLGGTLTASSSPGVGSTFTVTIARHLEADE